MTVLYRDARTTDIHYKKGGVKMDKIVKRAASKRGIIAASEGRSMFRAKIRRVIAKQTNPIKTS